MNLNKQKPIILKTNFIGDSNVGKTSLIYRQAAQQFLTGELYSNTIGCDFRTKCYDFNGYKIKGQFWDTVGAERFITLSQPAFRNSNAIKVCFDLSNYKSFQNVQKWVKIASQHIDKSQIFLIGCKSDLKHEVDKETIQKFCQIHGLVYFETSAKSGKGVNQCFTAIIAIVTPKKIQQMIKNGQNPLQIKQIQNQNRSSCW